VKEDYKSRKVPLNAIIRDINRLFTLGAVTIARDDTDPKNPIWYIGVRLDWPTRITEGEFFRSLAKLPKSKTYGFLSSSEP
jgi:hypothetical protein